MKTLASTIDISPMRPTTLGGYAVRPSPTTLSERLEANIAVLCDDMTNEPLIMISLDLLYPGRILRNALESALPELRPHQIFLAASHTHQAPMTDDTKPVIGVPDLHYLNTLTQRLSDEVRRIINADHMQTGAMFAATTTATHSINRRLKKRIQLSRKPDGYRITRSVRLAFNSYGMAPNPKGATDETVTVLVYRSQSGLAQFVIWNYACHPVAFPDRSRIAVNFPHHVRRALRSALGVADLPVLFFQGFSGNTRPCASADRSNGGRSRLRRLLLGPRFSDMTWQIYDSWANDLAALVSATCATSVRLSGEELSARRVLRDSSSFVQAAPEPAVSFHAVRLGSDFAIVGASAEVVAEFAPRVRAMTGASQVMCVGCLDHPFGYAPTRGILHEGGYEGGAYCRAFGLGPLAPSIEEEMLRGFAAVL